MRLDRAKIADYIVSGVFSAVIAWVMTGVGGWLLAALQPRAAEQITFGLYALLLASLTMIAFALIRLLWPEGIIRYVSRNIHHVTLDASVGMSGSLETKVIRASQPAPAEPPAVLRDAPNLKWQSPSFRLAAGSLDFIVVCTNTGPDAQVAPVSSVSSQVIPVGAAEAVPEPIGFEGFDVHGLIQKQPGRFDLVMRIPHPVPGDRTVTWTIVYFDTQFERGYVTECSVQVRYVLGTASVIGSPAFDFTSPQERHERYVHRYGSKRAGSTGDLPAAPEALYVFVGRQDEYYAGVPQRDLTATDFVALGPTERASVETGRLYRHVVTTPNALGPRDR